METLARKIWTDEELMALPKDGGKYELIDGKLTRMSPAGGNHSHYGTNILAAMRNFLALNRLGLVFGSDTGFRLNPDNVLSPDVAYSSMERLRRENKDLEGFVRGVPDLAVEVISPSERRGRIRLKMEKYFAQGTRFVWLAFPRKKIVEVYPAPDRKVTKTVGDELDCADLLPGFRLPVAEVFEDWF